MKTIHKIAPCSRRLLIGLCVLLAIAGAVGRIIPVMDNFAPIGALALFAGAMLPRLWYAWIVPVVGLLLGDVLISIVKNHILWTQSAGFAMQRLFDLSAFIFIAWLGRAVLSTNRTSWRIGFSTLASSAIFFIISNFGVWLICQFQPETGLAYAPTLGGLINCYYMGLPFYRGTLLGDLIYSAIFFGLVVLAERHARTFSTSNEQPIGRG